MALMSALSEVYLLFLYWEYNDFVCFNEYTGHVFMDDDIFSRL